MIVTLLGLLLETSNICRYAISVTKYLSISTKFNCLDSIYSNYVIRWWIWTVGRHTSNQNGHISNLLHEVYKHNNDCKISWRVFLKKWKQINIQLIPLRDRDSFDFGNLFSGPSPHGIGSTTFMGSTIHGDVFNWIGFHESQITGLS
jgi:hypothetical protein